jgi:tryptophan-rich sensory protein
MICFSFFMASITDHLDKKVRVKIYLIYAIQWFLNVLWNPTFFYLHEIFMGLFIISLLFIVVCYFLYEGIKRSRILGLLILPYFIWLLIAFSLNCYIWMFN